MPIAGGVWLQGLSPAVPLATAPQGSIAHRPILAIPASAIAEIVRAVHTIGAMSGGMGEKRHSAAILNARHLALACVEARSGRFGDMWAIEHYCQAVAGTP